MFALLQFLQSYLPKSEKGQDLTEYGLLVAVIALVVIAGAILFGDALLAFFSDLATTVGGW
jgi:Flp pilus assembly pilin Flp